MSQDALEQFMTQVEGSADLQARIGEEIEADALVALGAEHGCEFTVEDIRAGGTAESAGELSDEQLEPVAGGVLGDGSGRFLRGSGRVGLKVNIDSSRFTEMGPDNSTGFSSIGSVYF